MQYIKKYKCTDGRYETVAFDKITARINKLCYSLDMNFVDPVTKTQKAFLVCIKKDESDIESKMAVVCDDEVCVSCGA